MTIYEAMSKVSDSIRYIQRKGRNAAQGYNYVMESDVKDAFHREFARQGILFLPTVEQCDLEPHLKGGDKGEYRAGYLATMRLRVVLSLANPDQETIRALAAQYEAVAIGQGYDSTDKAVNKAYTSAIKNFLIATFLVPSGDDPEMDEDGQALDVEAITSAFESVTKSLKVHEPSKDKHKEIVADFLGHYKTLSKRPVEHPGEFASRADAAACLAGLKQIEKMWRADRVTAEAESGQAQEQAAGLFGDTKPSTSKKAIKG